MGAEHKSTTTRIQAKSEKYTYNNDLYQNLLLNFLRSKTLLQPLSQWLPDPEWEMSTDSEPSNTILGFVQFEMNIYTIGVQSFNRFRLY